MDSLQRIARVLLDTPPRRIFLYLWHKALKTKNTSETSLQHFEWLDLRPCVFCLSTGRVGTQTLESLLDQIPAIFSHHEPRPLLYGLSQQAYLINQPSTEVNQLLIESFVACRQDILSYAWQCNRGYVETSPQVTFLAPTISQLMPQTKFVHVIRNPGDVIRSAMRRGWYNGHPSDRTRIFPRSNDPAFEDWSGFTPFQKNIWLWKETNRWIADFGEAFSADQWLFIRSEDIFSNKMETIECLFRFLGQPMPKRRMIHQILNQQLNVQTSGTFPLPEKWSAEMHNQFHEVAGDTAKKFGYSL